MYKKLLLGIFFFVFWIKFGKTKQKIVAFIATALKSLFSIAKANGSISGHKLCAGNIKYSFLNILAHIFPLSAYKKVRNRSRAPKNVAPCRDANFFTLPYNTEKHTKGSIHFCRKDKSILSHVNHSSVMFFFL